MSATPHSIIYQLEATEIPTGLQSRIIRVSQDQERAQLILLLHGSLSINQEKNIQGPALLWDPRASGNNIKVSAGSEACFLTIPSAVLLRIHQFDLGNEGRRLIPEHNIELNLTHYTELQQSVHQALLAIISEVQRNNGSSLTLIFAHMSIIWVNLWRHVGAEEMMRTAQKDIQSVLQRFRELVEAHYQEHWTITQYSEALNISHDRLYASCKREINMTPLRVVHERLIEESKLALERSALNMEQIADTLGFRDSTHFSHFFKRIAKCSPRQYRLKRRQISGLNSPAHDQDFVHWP